MKYIFRSITRRVLLLMICESDPDKKYGYLATDKYYKNFILELDFKQEADGDKLTSWLNGKKMVSLEDEKIGEGSIALQIHSGGGIKIE